MACKLRDRGLTDKSEHVFNKSFTNDDLKVSMDTCLLLFVSPRVLSLQAISFHSPLG